MKLGTDLCADFVPKVMLKQFCEESNLFLCRINKSTIFISSLHLQDSMFQIYTVEQIQECVNLDPEFIKIDYVGTRIRYGLVELDECRLIEV
jgi:hypothetical protein